MIWLILAILAYLFFALNAVGDKFLLSGSALTKASTYAFYVGALGLALILFVPFLGLPVPNSFNSLFVALLAGALFIAALIPFFSGLKKFEASSMIPATGALQPIIILLLSFIFFPVVPTLSWAAVLAFVLLLAGSVLITWEKRGRISKASLGFASLAAFLFGLSFVLLKQTYLLEPFWSGLFWSRLGGGIMCLFIWLGMPTVRSEVLSLGHGSSRGSRLNVKKTAVLFLATQALGVVAGFLQQGSIFMAPVYAVPIVSALQGVQYVFILLLAVFAARKFPSVFQDFYSRGAALRKIIATSLIIMGIILLVNWQI